ncbi:RCC1 domain-containing protein, partial [Bifidobacterium xylocopae]
MRHTRTRRTTATALAMTLAIATIGGGGAARQAPANPPPNRTPTSESVDGFTLSPTKGPANTAGTHTTITPPTSGITFTQISAGNGHSLAIGSDGNTYAWGDNEYGQLGNGTGGDRNIPVRVHAPAGVRFTQVSAGYYYSLAIGDDGHAYSWGYNGHGQLGNGSSDWISSNPTPARIIDPAPGTTWTTISAGHEHSLGIDNHGHAYSWGRNIYGQLGDNSNGTNSPNYDNADKHTPVRVTDPAPGTTWTAVSAGDGHSLGIDSDGHAYGWGRNRFGQLGNGSSDNTPRPTPARVTDPTAGTTWKTISAGDEFSLAIDSNGHAYSWGANNGGQLGNGSSDGIYGHFPHPTPARVTDPTPNTHWTTISAGHGHGLAIDNNGHAYSWGYNYYGELGNGGRDGVHQTPHPTPARVTDPTPNTTWTTISAGYEHSLAIDNHGHASSCGLPLHAPVCHVTPGPAYTGTPHPPLRFVSPQPPVPTARL